MEIEDVGLEDPEAASFLVDIGARPPVSYEDSTRRGGPSTTRL